MRRWLVVAVALLAAGCSAAGPSGARSPAADPPPPPPASASPPAALTQDVTFAFAGDVHFTGRTASRLTGHSSDVLGPIGATLAAADIGMVNLETAITTRGTAEPKKYHFRTRPEALTALGAEGVDVVTMANNHAVDYGPVGLRDTLDGIKTTGFPVVGIGADAAQAYAPHVFNVRGTRVAILGASQVIDSGLRDTWIAGESRPGMASAIDPVKLVAAVRSARASADAVIVYVHWGIEGDSCASSTQRSLAKDLADAGATAVVGAHAHTLVGAGWLGQTYVSYGMGNFLWYSSGSHSYSGESGVITLRLHAGRVVAATFTPALLDGGGVPQPAAGAVAARISARFAALRGCSRLSAGPTG